VHLGAHAETIEVEPEALADSRRGETEIALETIDHLAVLAARMIVEISLQAIARGAYDFYQKPVDIDALGLIGNGSGRVSGLNRTFGIC